jgi:hypothetical protein
VYIPACLQKLVSSISSTLKLEVSNVGNKFNKAPNIYINLSLLSKLKKERDRNKDIFCIACH